jgi:DNA-nicking Smr family endonuclease
MTRRSRLPSSEERELLETAFKDVKPLKGRKPPPPKTSVPTHVPPVEPEVVVAPAPLSSKRPSLAGLDGRTTEKLRRGQLDPEARLDLHGLTEATAHGALATFLRSAQARGLRLVLVVTGQGQKEVAADAPFDMERDLRARGVLKTMTPRWLAEPALARFVTDICPAHRRHGGGGALYVYLRKPAL